jgi:hypothetical protein
MVDPKYVIVCEDDDGYYASYLDYEQLKEKGICWLSELDLPCLIPFFEVALEEVQKLPPLKGYKFIVKEVSVTISVAKKIQRHQYN